MKSWSGNQVDVLSMEDPLTPLLYLLGDEAPHLQCTGPIYSPIMSRNVTHFKPSKTMAKRIVDFKIDGIENHREYQMIPPRFQQ